MPEDHPTITAREARLQEGLEQVERMLLYHGGLVTADEIISGAVARIRETLYGKPEGVEG